MPSEMERYTTGIAGWMADRRTGQALVRLEGQTLLERARLQGEAQLQLDRAEAVGLVGFRAATVCAEVWSGAQELARQVPASAEAVEAIARGTTLELLGVVHETRSRLR